jgi:hypothetical protein
MRKSIGAIFNRGANSSIVLSIVKLPSERARDDKPPVSEDWRRRHEKRKKDGKYRGSQMTGHER